MLQGCQVPSVTYQLCTISASTSMTQHRTPRNPAAFRRREIESAAEPGEPGRRAVQPVHFG